MIDLFVEILLKVLQGCDGCREGLEGYQQHRAKQKADEAGKK